LNYKNKTDDKQKIADEEPCEVRKQDELEDNSIWMKGNAGELAHKNIERAKEEEALKDYEMEDDTGVSKRKIKHQINQQISENGVEEIDLEERPATAQCSVCGEFGLHSKIKHHIYRHHKDIEDKKVKFVNKTYHSCRLCSKKVVFTEDCIYGHISRCHEDVSFKQYWCSIIEELNYKNKTDDKQKIADEEPCEVRKQDELEDNSIWMKGNAGELAHKNIERAKEEEALKDYEMEDDTGVSKRKIKHQINQQISENGVEEIDLEERPATAQCSVCGEFGLHSKIKHHIYRHHKDIEDKKVKFVNKTYHSCRLCSKKVVFTRDCIYSHIRRHHSSLRFKQYWNFIKKQMSNRTNTEKNMRAMDLWKSEAPKQLKESENQIIDVVTGNEYASEKTLNDDSLFATHMHVHLGGQDTI